MTGIYEVANSLAVLSGGRYPVMAEQTSYDGAPVGAAAGASLLGTDLKGVLEAFTKVALREFPSYRQAVVTIPNFVAGQTYTVTINATAYAHLDVTGIEADTYTALEALIDVGATRPSSSPRRARRSCCASASSRPRGESPPRRPVAVRPSPSSPSRSPQTFASGHPRTIRP